MLDERLEDQKKKLEAAINKALTESAQINAAVQEMRDAGYDVFLIIEATIGFSRKEEVVYSTDASLRLPLTSQDERFLRSLKISPE
jgi:nicotinamidase-related amidase